MPLAFRWVPQWVVNGANNAGLLIVNDGAIGVDFRSSEYGESWAPVLIVRYTP
jgi:hypothetical protein